MRVNKNNKNNKNNKIVKLLHDNSVTVPAGLNSWMFLALLGK